MHQKSKILKHYFPTIAAMAVSLTYRVLVPGLKADEVQGTVPPPAIPLSDTDLVLNPDGSIPNHLQAIASTAGFHFAFIEQGGREKGRNECDSL